MKRRVRYELVGALRERYRQSDKKAKTKIMFRKIIARADLSEWEFHTMAGVYSRAIKSVRWEREKGDQ